MSFFEEHQARQEGRKSHVSGKDPIPAPPPSSLGVKHEPKPYEHQDYPCFVKHAEKGKQLVNSAAEHEALGDGWEKVGHEPEAQESK